PKQIFLAAYGSTRADRCADYKHQAATAGFFDVVRGSGGGSYIHLLCLLRSFCPWYRPDWLDFADHRRCAARRDAAVCPWHHWRILGAGAARNTRAAALHSGTYQYRSAGHGRGNKCLQPAKRGLIHDLGMVHRITLDLCLNEHRRIGSSETSLTVTKRRIYPGFRPLWLRLSDLACSPAFHSVGHRISPGLGSLGDRNANGRSVLSR